MCASAPWCCAFNSMETQDIGLYQPVVEVILNQLAALRRGIRPHI